MTNDDNASTADKGPPAPVWRDDFKSEDFPTISRIVFCAEDPIATDDGCALVIHHVRYFHGKGFMPAVRWGSSGSGGNGEVYDCSKADAYAQALTEGRAMLAKETERLAHLMLEHERRRSS